MPNKTSIEWTDYTANLIRYRDASGQDVWACAKISPGCRSCYAETIAHRYGRGGPFTLKMVEAVTPYFAEEEARKILRSKSLAGQRVFVGDMTDVFGAWVPDELLDRMFAVFALRPDVTFQVLTKRADRMLAYMTRLSKNIKPLEESARGLGYTFKFRSLEGKELSLLPWPLPNVHLGVSVEDQQRADERIPLLLQTPAAVRFISAEPLLGPVTLFREWRGLGHRHSGQADDPEICCCGKPRAYHTRIDWVIVGGESGPEARPCDVAWVRSLVGQCQAAGVPCFVKQLGAHPLDLTQLDADQRDNDPLDEIDLEEARLDLVDRKGGSPDEWPADLRVRQFPQTPPG